MKKIIVLVLLGVIGAAGFAAWRQLNANRGDDDLWSDATAEPDLR